MDEVIALLEQLMQQAAEVADELSDEEIEAILQVFTQAVEFISGYEEKSFGGPGIKPELPPAPFPSSNINSFKYDPDKQQLFVKFHGKDTANSGPIYSYDGIPEYIFDVFRRGAVGPKTTGKNKYHAWYKGVTPSLGAAMDALIKKGGFPYERVA